MATAAQAKMAGEWNVDETAAWLKGLSLGTEASKAEKQGLTGHDLEIMTSEEVASTLGCDMGTARTIKQDLRSRLFDMASAHPELDEEDDFVAAHAEEVSVAVDTSGAQPALGSGYTKLSTAKGAASGGGQFVVDDGTLKQYVGALEVIRRVEGTGVELQLPAEKQKLAGLDDIVKCKTTEYDDLVKGTKYAEAKVKAANKGSKGIMGKIVHGSLSGPTTQQAEDLKAAAQAQYDEVSKKMHACEQVLQDSKATAAAQRAVVEGMQADVDALLAARDVEAGVTAAMFKGAAGDARENALEAEVDALLPQVEAARQTKATFHQVDEMLKSSLKKMEQAEDKWHNAKHIGKWDWMWRKVTGTKGNVVLDLQKTSHCQAALALARSGLLDLEQAKAALPDLPKLELAKLAELKSSGLKNAYVDPTLSEKQHNADVKANMKEINKLEKAVAASQKWLHSWLDKRVAKDLEGLEVQLAAKKSALDVYRRELMVKELQARGLVATL